ncbi:SH3 domain-binding protein 5 [Manis javanica]|nr:SH3 domain-binding protein 5 [Manis javanica]
MLQTCLEPRAQDGLWLLTCLQNLPVAAKSPLDGPEPFPPLLRPTSLDPCPPLSTSSWAPPPGSTADCSNMGLVTSFQMADPLPVTFTRWMPPTASKRTPGLEERLVRNGSLPNQFFHHTQGGSRK